MLRVRLKADGRLVEVLPDGSERAIPSDARSIASAAHNAARAADGGFSDATYARNVRGRTGLTQAAFASIVSLIPGVLLFRMAGGLLELVGSSGSAQPDVAAAVIADG